MLRPIVFALQKSFDVGGDLLPLRSKFLASGKFFGSGNAVTPGTLGNVHACISHANDVFYGKAVHGKTGHTEAAGDVMFAKHCIRGNPLAQAFRQNLRLLGAGFRHEDDELISAVTGNNVRLAGFLLEQPSDAGQHQIALEVPQGVIHFLEFGQVDQHDRERSSRTRSTLPFCRQRLPEESSSLDSRQTVGDGLLLQLLKDESIVQSGGQKIRQGVENENVLRKKCALVAAFNVQCAEQSFAVGDGNAQDRPRLWQDRADLAFYAVLHQRPFTRASHAPEDANAQWDPSTHGVRRSPGSRLDFDSLRTIIKQADADVIEAEILLDFSHNLAQHMNWIVTRNCCARDVVEERQLPGAPLLFGEQARILYRNRYLSSGSHQHVQVALFEDIFAFRIHRDHDPCRLAPQHDRRGAQTLGRMLWPVPDAQSRPRLLQVRTYQQGLSSANHIFGKRVLQFTFPLGQDQIILDLKFEADFVAFLECDVEIAVIENLPQLRVDGSQHFILIEARTDRLPDLGEQFVLLGAAVSCVRNQIVFHREAKLQCQPHHEARAGGPERFALRVRKDNDSECLFAGLEAHGGEIADFGFLERILKAGEGSGRAHRQWLGHLTNISNREEPSLSVGAVADIFSCATVGKDVQKFRGEAALHRRQQATPALGDVDDGALGGQSPGQSL